VNTFKEEVDVFIYAIELLTDALNKFNEPNAAVLDVNVFNCEIELLTLAEVVSKFVSLPAAEDVNVFNEVISVVLPPPNDDVDTNVETLLPLPTQVYPFCKDAVNEPVTFNEPVISANPLFCIIKLLPLVKTKDELFVVSEVAIVVNDVTVNEPVIIWFPLNEFEPVVAYEPVFELNCCIELLTLAV
jgi:hypothetical protein